MPAIELRQDEIGVYDPAAYRAVRARVRPNPPPVVVPARVRLGVTLYDKPIGPIRIFAMPKSNRRDVLYIFTKTDNRMEVVRRVAVRHALSPMVIMGRSRIAEVVAARQEVVYRLHQELGVSFAQIGRFLKQADHSSALHAYRRFSERLAAGDVDLGEPIAIAAE